MSLLSIGRRNLGTRLIAIVLACGVWIVTSAQRRETTQDRLFNVPVALVGTSRTLIITSPLPDTVSIRLRGKESVIRSISSQDLLVELDLSSATSGEFDVPISSQSGFCCGKC